MAASGDEYLEEIQLLEEIYINELTVSKNEKGRPDKVELLLHPATGEDAEKQFVCLTLEICLPIGYPDELPEIHIRNSRGLADEHIDELRNTLLKESEEKLGENMLYDLIEMTKESLTQSNVPHGKCAVCLDQFYESDDFSKTECYHYFHGSCLLRYIEHELQLIKEEEKEQETLKHLEKKERLVVCPVCRKPITYDTKVLSNSKKLPDEKIEYEPDEQMKEMQRKMAKLYEKQKNRGGIIDLEAEKNKFLLPQSASTSNIEELIAYHNEETKLPNVLERPFTDRDKWQGRSSPLSNDKSVNSRRRSAGNLKCESRRDSWSDRQKTQVTNRRQDDLIYKPKNRKDLNKSPSQPRDLAHQFSEKLLTEEHTGSSKEEEISLNENLSSSSTLSLQQAQQTDSDIVECVLVERDINCDKNSTANSFCDEIETCVSSNDRNEELDYKQNNRVNKVNGISITDDDKLNSNIEGSSTNLDNFTSGDDLIHKSFTKHENDKSKVQNKPGEKKLYNEQKMSRDDESSCGVSNMKGRRNETKINTPGDKESRKGSGYYRYREEKNNSGFHREHDNYGARREKRVSSNRETGQRYRQKQDYNYKSKYDQKPYRGNHYREKYKYDLQKDSQISDISLKKETFYSKSDLSLGKDKNDSKFNGSLNKDKHDSKSDLCIDKDKKDSKNSDFSLTKVVLVSNERNSTLLNDRSVIDLVDSSHCGQNDKESNSQNTGGATSLSLINSDDTKESQQDSLYKKPYGHKNTGYIRSAENSQKWGKAYTREKRPASGYSHRESNKGSSFNKHNHQQNKESYNTQQHSKSEVIKANYHQGKGKFDADVNDESQGFQNKGKGNKVDSVCSGINNLTSGSLTVNNAEQQEAKCKQIDDNKNAKDRSTPKGRDNQFSSVNSRQSNSQYNVTEMHDRLGDREQQLENHKRIDSRKKDTKYSKQEGKKIHLYHSKNKASVEEGHFSKSSHDKGGSVISRHSLSASQSEVGENKGAISHKPRYNHHKRKEHNERREHYMSKQGDFGKQISNKGVKSEMDGQKSKQTSFVKDEHQLGARVENINQLPKERQAPDLSINSIDRKSRHGNIERSNNAVECNSVQALQTKHISAPPGFKTINPPPGFQVIKETASNKKPNEAPPGFS